MYSLYPSDIPSGKPSYTLALPVEPQQDHIRARMEGIYGKYDKFRTSGHCTNWTAGISKVTGWGLGISLGCFGVFCFVFLSGLGGLFVFCYCWFGSGFWFWFFLFCFSRSQGILDRHFKHEHLWSTKDLGKSGIVSLFQTQRISQPSSSLTPVSQSLEFGQTLVGSPGPARKG